MTPDPFAPPDPVRRFSLNERGRDFVVGDIHGMFDYLETLLDEVEFDPDKDRLFSVGDLVDRGPRSAEALDWCRKPWFHVCRGNHEQFALEAEDPELLDVWVGQNGGAWWLELGHDDRRAFISAVLAMPIAMEVETASGKIGIVHADVPPGMSWDEFLARLEEQDGDCLLYAIWSRQRITGALGARPVSGSVKRVYCGHTPTRCVVAVENVVYIDTGAVYSLEGYEEARLSLVQIHPNDHQEFGISTFYPANAGSEA